LRGELKVVPRYALVVESIYGGAVPIETDESETSGGAVVAESAAAATSEKTWIAIRMTDGLGDPARGLKYKVTLPDGGAKEGTLDDQGLARVASAGAGTCTITFPDLDSGDWDSA
jgi:hypothetical protein